MKNLISRQPTQYNLWFWLFIWGVILLLPTKAFADSDSPLAPLRYSEMESAVEKNMYFAAANGLNSFTCSISSDQFNEAFEKDELDGETLVIKFGWSKGDSAAIWIEGAEEEHRHVLLEAINADVWEMISEIAVFSLTTDWSTTKFLWEGVDPETDSSDDDKKGKFLGVVNGWWHYSTSSGDEGIFIDSRTMTIAAIEDDGKLLKFIYDRFADKYRMRKIVALVSDEESIGGMPAGLGVMIVIDYFESGTIAVPARMTTFITDKDMKNKVPVSAFVFTDHVLNEPISSQIFEDYAEFRRWNMTFLQSSDFGYRVRLPDKAELQVSTFSRDFNSWAVTDDGDVGVAVIIYPGDSELFGYYKNRRMEMIRSKGGVPKSAEMTTSSLGGYAGKKYIAYFTRNGGEIAWLASMTSKNGFVYELTVWGSKNRIEELVEMQESLSEKFEFLEDWSESERTVSRPEKFTIPGSQLSILLDFPLWEEDGLSEPNGNNNFVLNYQNSWAHVYGQTETIEGFDFDEKAKEVIAAAGNAEMIVRRKGTLGPADIAEYELWEDVEGTGLGTRYYFFVVRAGDEVTEIIAWCDGNAVDIMGPKIRRIFRKMKWNNQGIQWERDQGMPSRRRGRLKSKSDNSLLEL